MSWRTAPPADRAAKNQQTIKTLLKLEGNKICSDCKRNKHPRWASWNLGIFICIRCSGIHRGMGTHISRVKSVDLDAWTDEQLQSVLKWGNTRANKYWEAKLAAGHVPSDAKIENFIRTKYESKRWVMDGPIPDPSTLSGDGDDDVPLNVVQEKAKLDRATSRVSSISSQPAPARPSAGQPFDLMGGDLISSSPARSGTSNVSNVKPPASKAPPPSQLLGLDFFGGPPQKSMSASSTANSGPSRPDLKQSILSLYATVPKASPATTQAPLEHNRQSSFGGMQKPAGKTAFSDLDDAFGGLKFGGSSHPPPVQAQPSMSTFPNFTSLQPTSTAPQITTSSVLGGSNFFSSAPNPPPKAISTSIPAITTTAGLPSLTVRKSSNASDGFGDFSAAMHPNTASSMANSSNGLLDLGSPAPPMVQSARPANPSIQLTSVFNLSARKASSNYTNVTQSSAPATKTSFHPLSNADAWGSSDTWADNGPAVMTPQTGRSRATTETISPPIGTSANANDFGWGNSPIPSAKAGPTSAGGFGHSPQSSRSGFGGGFAAVPIAAPAPTMTTTALDAFSGGWGNDTVMPMVARVAAEEDFGDWGSNVPVTPAVGTASMMAAEKMTPAKAPGTEDPWSNVWE